MTKPVVYACMGCSNVGRMAHDIALTLDQDGLAEMSNISGIVADNQSLMSTLKSAVSVIVIDGCEEHCSKECLSEKGVEIDQHFTLTAAGIEKRDKWQDSLLDNSKAVNYVYQKLQKAYQD